MPFLEFNATIGKTKYKVNQDVRKTDDESIYLPGMRQHDNSIQKKRSNVLQM